MNDEWWMMNVYHRDSGFWNLQRDCEIGIIICQIMLVVMLNLKIWILGHFAWKSEYCLLWAWFKWKKWNSEIEEIRYDLYD